MLNMEGEAPAEPVFKRCSAGASPSKEKFCLIRSFMTKGLDRFLRVDKVRDEILPYTH